MVNVPGFWDLFGFTSFSWWQVVGLFFIVVGVIVIVKGFTMFSWGSLRFGLVLIGLGLLSIFGSNFVLNVFGNVYYTVLFVAVLVFLVSAWFIFGAHRFVVKNNGGR